MNNSKLTFKEITTPNEMSYAFIIRKDVFIKEQNVDVDLEIDGEDDKANQYLLLEGDKPVGTLRVFLDLKTRSSHIGRVAIIKDKRKLGYGKFMMNKIINILKENYSPLRIEVESQLRVTKFYESLGFIPVSEEIIMDAGIEHIQMYLNV
jgi:predicted GNAT family N-acyltransferase